MDQNVGAAAQDRAQFFTGRAAVLLLQTSRILPLSDILFFAAVAPRLCVSVVLRPRL
jgi:hypothetical protein